ncbi:hypothetical protein FE257_005449 [Aspergillus nanangensis]|uniref:Uncharacterized protein n=1 Tax=Aspergillus nanangensis TaxID=2582783 RepID=A0AAD4CR41_ASPNN|nr:hypothetical protein FE257_005449 [Aspergillus nanangensis]
MSLPRQPPNIFRKCFRSYLQAPLPPTISSSRKFHPTPTPNAARSPTVRRAEAAKASRQPGLSTDYLSKVPVQGNLTSRLELLEKQGMSAWAEIIRSGSIHKDVSSEMFLGIARKLLESAYRQPPSAGAILNISKDIDLVYNISHFISFGDDRFREWALSSCALAGARVPSLITAARYLSNTKDLSTSAATQPQILQHVEAFALRDQDPRAMVVHAKVLALRGDKPAALALLEQVLSMTTPTRRRPSPDEDFLLPGITTPWNTYLTLKKEMGLYNDTDAEQILQPAAKEYFDPTSLVRYAQLQLRHHNDRDAYEEYMGMAAMSGHSEACYRLANFYYLTSRGKFPRRGARTIPMNEDSHDSSSSSSSSLSIESPNQGLLARYLPRFYAPKPHGEYLSLALHWYHISAAHGSTRGSVISKTKSDDVLSRAAVMIALISREEGLVAKRADRVDHGFQWLQKVGNVPEIASFVRQLRLKWDDEGFLPVPPEAVVGV